MKKVFFLTLSLIAATSVQGSDVTEFEPDSIRAERLQEVVIDGVRAHGNEPFAVTDIDRSRLDSYSKSGRELPFLFARTPGVIAWSDNGTGIGTTYLRIRGAADSRINVTLDGVPLNSPEDQCVFWANMNSYASLLGSAQVQRGIGTSTVGDGAFGGSVALTSKLPNPRKGFELTASYGSFNTLRLGGSFSSGTVMNSLIIDGAYHITQTDGYIHGTTGKAGSYYGGLLWTPGDNVMIRYRNIGNFENTGQAWNGVTAGTDDLSIMDGTYGERTGIKTYRDMWNAGLGKFNSLYEALTVTPLEQKTAGNPYSYSTNRYQMNDGSYWDRTTDNFRQDHNILSFAWNVSDHLSTSLTAHYTYGYGYYEEFRYQNKLKKFGLSNYKAPDGTTVKKSDFVRKKGLEQHTYGIIWNTGYTTVRSDLRSGISFQQFKGNHFGHITYVGNQSLSDYLLADGRYTYYDSDAYKTDISAYIKAGYDITGNLHAFADAQYRHVGYRTDGYNDKFMDNGDGTYGKHWLDIDKGYDFINARAGLTWIEGGHRLHALAATAGREPERNNFTDNGTYPAPEPEYMADFEAGYSYEGLIWNAGVNLYYMDYRNQFVQTGLKSDIGENLTTNIKGSYRAGVELTASVNPFPWLEIEGNAALSRNRIKDFDEVVEDWDDWEGNPDAATYHCDGDGDGFRSFHYDNSTLAFSPSAILNGFISFNFGKVRATWHTGHVSRQYLDNTGNSDRSLPAYSLSDLSFSYTLPMRKVLNSIVIGAELNNVLNARCATSGWVYSALYESGGHGNDNRYYQIGFIPAAAFSALAHVTLKF
ncbi:MAG: TonB-dependent receptor plug domain-containing protein [Bacteroidaceae bacterium]|nr:TonB-dependent receptor plug domain-containing protein [Bacteroidaceae bacterium]MBO7589176.1 TonB-dependent receptor plug domain-containing protein [Bacteroidaceae bacterium]